jgi:hypothetical protein
MGYKTVVTREERQKQYRERNKVMIAKRLKAYRLLHKMPNYIPKKEQGGRFFYRVKENDGSWGEFSGRFGTPERAVEWFKQYWADSVHLVLKLVEDGFRNKVKDGVLVNQ